MSGLPSDPPEFVPSLPRLKAPGDGARPLGDFWQWLGLSGDALGTNGTRRRTFLYSLAAVMVMVAAINLLNIITSQHDEPAKGLAGPFVWEVTSWLTVILFFWIPWIGYRLAPPFVRPRWRLVVHVPMALLFSLGHVSGFVALRKLVYWSAGEAYNFGAFIPHFLYEFRKDALAYALFIAGFALIEHLLRQQQLIDTPGQTLTFDIRDGARLNRVRLEDVLAIASAGNYVEFILRDGRKLLMRSALTALESELGGRGFVRTHRSWLVNASQVTSLTPAGSGDYAVQLGEMTVPLSRRFRDALAALRLR